jgi:hypothetical protein
MIWHLKNVLASFGIRLLDRNFDLSSGAGELPPIECWPELWVVDDEKALRPKDDFTKNPWRRSGRCKIMGSAHRACQ